MKYAGIGSRETPSDILDNMRIIGKFFAKNGLVLRSGAADGADSAFELGCDSQKGDKEIWLPWARFNNHSSTLTPKKIHFDLASTVHPRWDKLSQGPKKLHARNMGQILGEDLDDPVDFVVCWTRDGCETASTRTKETGGTGSAIALASKYNIPVFNINTLDYSHRFMPFVNDVLKRLNK